MFFGQKSILSQKNNQNLLRDWYIFWKRVLSSLHNFFQSWSEHCVQQEVNPFFYGPESRFLAQTFFCHSTPVLVNGPFVALGETVHFPPWDRFLDFSFPSYGRFRQKKTWMTRQKVFPLPTVGAPPASNSPSALSDRDVLVWNICRFISLRAFWPASFCFSSLPPSWSSLGCCHLSLPSIFSYKSLFFH